MRDELEAYSRRRFLGNVTTGLMGVGLSHLLGSESLMAQKAASKAWRPGTGMTHLKPRAKRVLQIFCPGAASHMDLWEHKPMLEKYDGRPLPGEENMVSFQGKNGPLMRSPWEFEPAGESGKMFSTMLPHMAQHVDDIAFFHGMQSKTNTHGPGCVFVNTGHPTEGFPSAGAWVSYALGSMVDNLPTYVAIPDIRGEPPNGKANWSNGFLPAKHQAITMAAYSPIRNLEQPEMIGDAEEKGTRDLLKYLNTRHASLRPEETELQARMGAYELAAKMQMSAPEVSDFKSEPEHIHQLYGTDSKNELKAAYARNCLLSRRLLERGVATSICTKPPGLAEWTVC